MFKRYIFKILYDTKTLKYTGISKEINFATGDTVDLIIKAAVTGIDDLSHKEAHQVITISAKGRVKKISGGELGKAVKNEPDMEISLTYYKYEIDGVVITEIDKLNKISVINGKDLGSGIKNLLG